MKFFKKWTTLLRELMLTNLMLLLAISISFVENKKIPVPFYTRVRQIRIMLKHDETIYPTILYRYFPTEFPLVLIANQNSSVPALLYFIGNIQMLPFSNNNNNSAMTPREFWQIVQEQLPQMQQREEAENENEEIELLFQQPLLGSERNKRFLVKFCDEFANALNRTITNGEVFRSLRADIDAFRDGRLQLWSERLMLCVRMKYFATIMQWCDNEGNRRGIDVRLECPNKKTRDVYLLLDIRRHNVDSHTERYLSRIDSHFWSNSNNPNVSLLARFLFNLHAVPTRTINAQHFQEMMLREFARQQEQNRNASFVIGRPRAGPPFSGYSQLMVPIAKSIRYLIAETGIATREEYGQIIAKYRDLFESLRNDYWRYENAPNENVRNAIAPSSDEQSTRRRNTEYRLSQTKAALTIMNFLRQDWRNRIIDEEYLRRENDDRDDGSVEGDADLEQEQPANEILIPEQCAQQPQQQFYEQPQQHQQHPQQQPVYQPQQQHQFYQQPQFSQPHQQQLYVLRPQQQQHKQTHSQSKPSTSVRRAVSPDLLAQAMILGLISPSSAHSSNMAAGDNARKYLKTNPPENVQGEFAISDEFLDYFNDDNITYTLAYKR